MYRLRLFYVARVFLRAFGRRGEGAAPLLYRKGSTRTGGPGPRPRLASPRAGAQAKEELWRPDC